MKRATGKNFDKMEAQPDLLYMKSILVSTGANQNDDVFLPSEMLKARHSPKLKPVDWEHNTGTELTDDEMSSMPGHVVEGNQIIGVIYNTYVTDAEGNVINETTIASKDFSPPESFHIVDEAVIYKGLFPKSAKRIEEGAANGSLFVSMEAWFSDHDYLVGNKIVARNEETVFLDRALRANGGTGRFGKESVKRVLKNIVFGGKGIVEKPANKPSIIQSVTHEPFEIAASLIEKNIITQNTFTVNSNNGVITNVEELNQMADKDIKVVEKTVSLEDYNTALERAVASEQEVKAKNAELNAASAATDEVKDKLNNLQSSLTKGFELLETVLPGIKDKLTQASENDLFSAIADSIKERIAKLDEVSEELKLAKASIEEHETEKRTLLRKDKIRSELGLAGLNDDSEETLKAKEDQVSKMAEASSTMNDENFDSWLELNKNLVTLKGTQAAKNMNKEKKEDEENDAEETDASILDHVKASEQSPSAGTQKTDKSLAEEYSDLADFLMTGSK